MLARQRGGQSDGADWERQASWQLHQGEGVQALLVSSLFLRKRGAGQVDVARLKAGRVEIYEVKGGEVLSPAQNRRLLVSADFLSRILHRPSQLIFALSLKDCFAKKKALL